MRSVLVKAFVLMSIWSSGQQPLINEILKTSLHKQPAYITSRAVNEQFIYIPCGFGKAEIGAPSDSIDLPAVQITAVDLVFTDYPSDDPLTNLNTNRLKNLFKKYPFLSSNKTISWKLIRQTDGAERENALALFHGFVIYYKPPQSTATMKSDIEKLKIMLEPTIPDEAVKRRRGFVTGDTTELRKIYEIEDYTTVKKMPVTDALRYLDIDEREKVTYKQYDSLFVYEKPWTDSSGIKIGMKEPEDSTVLKVLDRMQWNNMLVVADVTASMYPYTGQLMIWLKFHEDERRIKHFIFFNDGDNRDDDSKVAGRTGGIYSTSSSVFDVVEQLAFKAMSNGSGGSIPENNIEALLFGLKTCADCSSVVMIADNSSAVSDMSLLKEINKPVHIILCGVHDAINTDYLNIAKSTGGSVHLAEEDLQQVATLKEGQMIEIHGRNYQIVNGRFVKTK